MTLNIKTKAITETCEQWTAMKNRTDLPRTKTLKWKTLLTLRANRHDQKVTACKTTLLKDQRTTHRNNLQINLTEQTLASTWTLMSETQSGQNDTTDKWTTSENHKMQKTKTKRFAQANRDWFEELKNLNQKSGQRQTPARQKFVFEFQMTRCPTACVTCGWAGVDKTPRAGFYSGVENCLRLPQNPQRQVHAVLARTGAKIYAA